MLHIPKNQVVPKTTTTSTTSTTRPIAYEEHRADFSTPDKQNAYSDKPSIYSDKKSIYSDTQNIYSDRMSAAHFPAHFPAAINEACHLPNPSNVASY
jgi:hypothetical protein